MKVQNNQDIPACPSLAELLFSLKGSMPIQYVYKRTGWRTKNGPGKCNTCGEIKPASEFSTAKGHICKDCK